MRMAAAACGHRWEPPELAPARRGPPRRPARTRRAPPARATAVAADADPPDWWLAAAAEADAYASAAAAVTSRVVDGDDIVADVAAIMAAAAERGEFEEGDTDTLLGAAGSDAVAAAADAAAAALADAGGGEELQSALFASAAAWLLERAIDTEAGAESPSSADERPAVGADEDIALAESIATDLIAENDRSSGAEGVGGSEEASSQDRVAADPVEGSIAGVRRSAAALAALLGVKGAAAAYICAAVGCGSAASALARAALLSTIAEEGAEDARRQAAAEAVSAAGAWPARVRTCVRARACHCLGPRLTARDASSRTPPLPSQHTCHRSKNTSRLLPPTSCHTSAMTHLSLRSVPPALPPRRS